MKTMKTKLRSRLTAVSFALFAAFGFSSCASTGSGPASGTHTMGAKPGWPMSDEGMAGHRSTSATSTGTEAVMCDKCKTVWVRKPTTIGSPGRMQTTILRDSKTMTCPDCQLAINNFWKTGSMKHTCSHCGGTLAHCTQH